VRIKTLFLVVSLLVIALVPMIASAQAIDEFIYPPASTLAGQSGGSGWAAAWSSSTGTAPPPRFVITSGGLTFPGLITNGNAVKANYSGTGWAYINRWTSATYGAANQTTWVQFLIRPDSGYGQWGVINLGGGISTPGSVQVGLTSAGGNKYLAIQPYGVSDITTPYNWAQGATYLVQAKYTVDGTGSLVNVQAWLWANNISPVATVVGNNLSWSGVGNTFQLYSSGNYTYDQFRVGDRPDDPVPEAGTMVALGSFLSMGGLFLRRRFAKS
jgi:hypothetical protein